MTEPLRNLVIDAPGDGLAGAVVTGARGKQWLRWRRAPLVAGACFTVLSVVAVVALSSPSSITTSAGAKAEPEATGVSTATVGVSVAPQSPEPVPEKMINLVYGDTCAMCMAHRCKKTDALNCATMYNYTQPEAGGANERACMCGCCRHQCKREASCSIDWVVPPAIALNKTGKPQSIGLTFSGGGWRAMAAAMSIARILGSSDLGLLETDSLQAIGSNSGGSWFLTQFAYSQTFHDSVTGTPQTPGEAGVPVASPSMYDLVFQWMDEHDVVAGRVSDEVLAERLTTNGVWAYHTLMGHLQQYADLTSAFNLGNYYTLIETGIGAINFLIRADLDWDTFIKLMMEITDPALVTGTAEPGSQVGSTIGKTLVFMGSWITDATLRASDTDETAIDALLLNSADTKLEGTYDLYPLYYFGGDGSSASSYKMDDVNGYEPVSNAPANEPHKSVADPTPDVAKKQPLQMPFAGTTPSPYKIASMSSAAGGGLASPEVLRAIYATWNKYKSENEDSVFGARTAELAWPLKAILVGLSKQPELVTKCNYMGASSLFTFIDAVLCIFENDPFYSTQTAVCAQERAEGKPCTFPSGQTVDGGYVDNTAATSTLKELIAINEAIPAADRGPVRMIITTNTDCDELPPSSACKTNDLWQLFADYPDPSTGLPATPGDPTAAFSLESFGIDFLPPIQVYKPANQIFEFSMNDLAWDNVPHWQSGSSSVVFNTRVKTKTVQNDAYGIKAGVDVDLLLFASNGPVPLTVGFDASGADAYTNIATYAEDVAQAMIGRVTAKWFNEVANGDS